MNKLRKKVDHIKYYEAYLREKKNFSYNTINAYIKDVKDLICYYIKNNKNAYNFTKIDYQFLRKYVVHLKQEGYAERTIARKISSLRVFYKYLIQQGLVEKNPAEYVQIPKIKKKLPEFLFFEEVIKILNTPKKDTDKPIRMRDQAIIELLYGTGMRVTELSDLNTGDMNLDDDTITVMGKGSKERILPLSKPVKKALEIYLNSRDFIPRKNYRQLTPIKALFINCLGKRLSSRGIRRILNKYMRLACLNKKISPHVFRHTFATHLLNGGADLRSVQELLGHESLSTTQIYTHVTKDKLVKTYNKFIPRK